MNFELITQLGKFKMKKKIISNGKKNNFNTYLTMHIQPQKEILKK